MQRPSRAVLITLATSLALVAAVGLAGPHRALRWVQCAADRVQHGAARDLDGVVVRLPPSWWANGRDNPRGTSELRVARVPHSRSASRDPRAIVRHVNFDLSRANAERAFSTLAWDSPEFGSWEPQELLDVDLGGRPGYEIRYERAMPGPGGIDDVASDFVLPAERVWVQCGPMSADDLAQCREIAASATAAR
jgi:hypothetical protein